MTKQYGYTLTELLSVLVAFGIMSVLAMAGYTVVHFILKFW